MTKKAHLTLPKQQVVDALNEVYNIQELLQQNYGSYHSKNRSDADLLDICKKYLQKNINTFVHDTPWDDGSILGFFVAYPDRYEICLLNGMNYCYNKFALCKELFHIVIENPEFQSVNFEYTINKCVNGGALNGADSNEYVAEIAAMEYLFPFKNRVEIYKSGNIDFEKVAMDYRIPRLLVEKYLTDYRMKTLAECYKASSYMIDETLE